MAHIDDDGLARERLANAFPKVPERIFASVFTAYRQVTPTLSDAARAARRRIKDPCAF